MTIPCGESMAKENLKLLATVRAQALPALGRKGVVWAAAFVSVQLLCHTGSTCIKGLKHPLRAGAAAL